MTETELTITGIDLVVKDMAASVAFYRRLGLTVDDSQPWSSDHIQIELPNGTNIELDSIAMTKSYDPDWTAPGAGSRNIIMFGLSTRDAVDQLYNQLTKAGHPGHLAPIDAFWGARYAIVDDPDGNHIGLMSPMEERYQGSPPDL